MLRRLFPKPNAVENWVIDLPALRSRIGTLVGALGVVWGVSLFALYVDRGLVFDLALLPRRLDGLLGVFGMPLVHGSIEHLLANTAPLAILGGLLVARGAGYFLMVSLAIAVLGGLALWLFGRGSCAHRRERLGVWLLRLSGDACIL